MPVETGGIAFIGPAAVALGHYDSFSFADHGLQLIVHG
jgi:hypothetical protein